MIEQKEPTLIRSLFLVCSSQTTPETGRERSVRDGSVRAHQDGRSGVPEEYSSDRPGDGPYAQDDPQDSSGLGAEVPEEARPGLPGDGLGRRHHRGLAPRGSGDPQEAAPHSAPDLDSAGRGVC